MDWKEELLKLYVERGGILRGTFTLTSGATSDTYIDSRLVSTHPRSLTLIAERFSALLADDLKADPALNLIGPALSGISIAAVMSIQLGIAFLIDRGQKKGHGTGKRFEGAFTESSRCVIVDDLITRGTTVVALVEELRAMGKTVEKVFVVVDREEGGAHLLAQAGVACTALLTKDELIDAYARYKG